ncbi:putative zinc ribbon protein [Yersinia sp. 2466 StPb PI]|uniref:putative zinc ribbon protein n=1 Tax=Yersinia sp. 2466 StPb PI TaxID=3061648 RepID=UPI00355AFD2E
MYQHIRTALTAQGNQVNSTHLSPGPITEHYYCPSCHNQLQLLHSHFAERLFIHDQEHPDFQPERDCQCRYQIRATAMYSQTARTLNTWRSPIITPPRPRTTLPHRIYFCMLCQHEYRRRKTCPQCQQRLYRTEAR